jgi:hypothetical protein
VIVRIDGTEVDPDAVGPPALNYGQLERWEGCPRRTYEYVVPHDEFARLAASWWDGSCDELRDDLPVPDPRGTSPSSTRWSSSTTRR